MKWLAIWFAILAFGNLAAAAETAVIQIKSRPAASLIEAIRPALGPQARVSAFHDKLIVNGSKSEIVAARRIVGQLDRPPRRLIIEVRQRGGVNLSSDGIAYGVNTDNVRIGPSYPGDRARIGGHRAQTQGRMDSKQRIRALDGRPALIRTGQSTPVYQIHQNIVGNRVSQGFEVRYRDTYSGFHALPRVHGDQVTVEIYQQDERPSGNGRFALQQASTVLNGRLGEWLVLGAIGESARDRQDDIGRHVTTRRSADRRIELRVLAID